MGSEMCIRDSNRIVYELIAADTVETTTYAGVGISTDVGYFNPSASAEDILNNIDEVRDLSNSIYPSSLADELPLFNEAMKKGM